MAEKFDRHANGTAVFSHSDEIFDDPLRYHRPETQDYLIRQTLDPKRDAKKVPQIPLYSDTYPTDEVSTSLLRHSPY